MKKIYFILCLLTFGQLSIAQVNNVGIGTLTPHPSAILELESSNQGFLLPRMDQSGENGLPNPATGLMIYNTDINNGFGLSAPRFYSGGLWNTVLAQRPNGEIFLDNAGYNWFNTSAGAAIDFNINSGMVLRVESNQNVFIRKPGWDNNIHFINGNQITTRGDDGVTHKDLYLNYDGGAIRLGPGHLTLGPWGSWRAVFYADGNVQFSNQALGNSLLFTGGEHIEARSPDWQQARTLYLNHNDGDIRMGSDLVRLGGWNAQRTWFYSDGNVAFRKPGTEQNLLFINGNTINSSKNDWTTPQTLYIQSNGGDTQFGAEGATFNCLGTQGNHATFSTNNMTIDGDAIINGGNIANPELVVKLNPNHVGSGLPAYLDFDGWFAILSSSKRFKKDIRNAKLDFRKMLQLRITEYYYREGFQANGLQLGVIAEEADELGLSYLVARDQEQVINGFHYNKMGLYLLPLIREQDQILQAQEEELKRLQARLAELKKWKEEVTASLKD